MHQSDDRTSSTSAAEDRRVLDLLVVAVLALVAAGTALVGLRWANDGVEPEGQNWWLVSWFVAGSAYTLGGVFLACRRPSRFLGVCFLIVGLSAVATALAMQYRGYEAARPGPPRWPALADADAWTRPLGAAVLAGLVPWGLAPAGWGRHRWAKAVWITALVGTFAVVLAGALEWESVDRVAAVLIGLAGLVATAVLGVAWWRQRVTNGDPLFGWLFAGAVLAWLAAVPDGLGVFEWSIPGRDVVWALLFLATVPLLVVGALIEELRRSETGGGRVSHRSLEWMLLAAGITLLYTGVVAGLGRLVGGSGPTWMLIGATGAIALAIEPARHRIRQLVDRLVFGSRDDPLAVVQGIVDHVSGDTGDDPLPALVRSLQSGLCLDAVAIDLVTVGGGWQRAASVGPTTTRTREVLLHHRDEVVGRLVVGWNDGTTLRTRDTQLIDQLAGPLSLAVSWVRLAADLRRSSLAVVSAREEERRRLRRDLHDGVGPTLTGVSLGLRTAVRRLDRSSDRANTDPALGLLGRLADEIDGVVLEIKQIVRDLRPTALDQLGLVGAVAEFTRKFDDDLEIHLALPAVPARLPAAVEVAVYRIVTEALTNVVRHAQADRCWLTIEAGATVEIDVIDDGVGLSTGGRDGVGLTAMRERAAELGGSVCFVPDRERGTHLHVQLPAALP